MQKISTADGSETFLNHTVGESYHSQTGAVEEALKKFCEPCRVGQRAIQGHVRILDVCFGLGYNSAMAIAQMVEVNPYCSFEIIGLENDIEILKKIHLVQPAIPGYELLKDLHRTPLTTAQGTVVVHIDDARQKIKSLQDAHFDVVFFDPFSPGKMPEMWTAEFFAEIYRTMDDDGILATYSCARLVRDNLRTAGFWVSDGPKVGRRGPGTVATKKLLKTGKI